MPVATGQSKRRCRKAGTSACELGSITTTTTPGEPAPATTTTTLPNAPGFLGFSARAIGGRWNAEPASQEGDCTAARTTVPDVEVTCWVTVVLPASVGVAPAPPSGAALHFEAGGYSRRVPFTIYADGSGFLIGK